MIGEHGRDVGAGLVDGGGVSAEDGIGDLYDERHVDAPPRQPLMTWIATAMA
jgi:hypothetical protein